MTKSCEAVLKKAKLVSLGCANNLPCKMSGVFVITVVACMLRVFHISSFIIANS